MATFVLIASTLITNNSTTTVTFSGIPSDYTDLYVIGDVRGFRSDGAPQNVTMYTRINNQTGSLYFQNAQDWTASSTSSTFVNGQTEWTTGLTLPGNAADDGRFGQIMLYLPGYTESQTRKNCAFEIYSGYNTTSNTFARVSAGLYSNVINAIDRLDFIMTGTNTNFASNSKFALYGISKTV